MEEWQNMLKELMSTARIDDDRMQHKLLAVLQLLKRSQLAQSSHLAHELGRVLKTAGSASQAQVRYVVRSERRKCSSFLQYAQRPDRMHSCAPD